MLGRDSKSKCVIEILLTKTYVLKPEYEEVEEVEAGEKKIPSPRRGQGDEMTWARVLWVGLKQNFEGTATDVVIQELV